MNVRTAREGDSRYIAPELLQGRFTKAADIFSLGITILELTCRLELPTNGVLWHKLRSGVLPEEFIQRKFLVFNHQISLLMFSSHWLSVISQDLQYIIKWMLDPDPYKRPNVNMILATKKIQKILFRRKLLKPFKIIVSWECYNVVCELRF